MSEHGCARLRTTVAILLCLTASPAAAEVIAINHGTFAFTADSATGVLNISGTRGFRFDVGGTSGGNFQAIQQCQVPECQPGTVVDLFATWSGTDLRTATAQLRGKTYSDVGGLDSRNQAVIEFDGQVTMPPMSGGPVSITVPFEFAGQFEYASDPVSPTNVARLTGGGFVTLLLRPSPDFTSWMIERADFEFRPARRD